MASSTIQALWPSLPPPISFLSSQSAAAVVEIPPLTLSEAVSGIFGSISLSCWLFFLFPQLLENIRRQSASGISKLFLGLWLFGDITNLAGALLANLVPTAIWLAIYFTISDVILLMQVLYYDFVEARRKQRHKQRRTSSSASAASRPTGRRTARRGSTRDPTERDSLLGREHPSTAGSYHGTRSLSQINRDRRRDSRLLEPVAFPPLTSDCESGHSTTSSSISLVWYNVLAIFAVCIAGVAGWAFAYGTGVWKPTPLPNYQPHNPSPDDGSPSISGSDSSPSLFSQAMVAQILGYMSAAAYLGARIPQIIKNQKARSCEGLSLLLFILSMAGNLTYGIAIVAHSLDPTYLKTNIPWLLGSIGTMAGDAIIFAQFRAFGSGENKNSGGNKNVVTTGGASSSSAVYDDVLSGED